MTNILVTGVNGYLGSQLATALAERGDTVRGADFVQADLPGVECVAADMTDYETCLRLGAGMDVIAHMGAYHGAHLTSHSENDFFQANVTGLFNILRSAVENQISKLIWASSVVVYERGLWEAFGIYGLTKVLGEELCQFYNRTHQLKIIALRLGTFGSADFVERGFKMLGGPSLGNWIEPEEVVRAILTAIANQTIDFGIYDVQTPLPLTMLEKREYRRDKLGVLKRHWPQHADLLEKYEHLLPSAIGTVDMQRTATELGFRVERDFGWFLDELNKRESSTTEKET